MAADNSEKTITTSGPSAFGQAAASSAAGRLHVLDELRGLTLISMILYHFMWDLNYIVGLSMPWYRHGFGAHIWQQSICWTFILLSGFCWSLGHHPFKRGLQVFFCGMIITAVTFAIDPQLLVLFGVLTLIGSSMLMMIPVDLTAKHLLSGAKGKNILLPALTVTVFVFFLYCLHQGRNLLPETVSVNLFTAYLGFPPAGFQSTDYFPIVPWFFLFTTGYLLHKCWCLVGIQDALAGSHVPFLAFIGRHCLLIYMLHQPVLYGISLVIKACC